MAGLFVCNVPSALLGNFKTALTDITDDPVEGCLVVLPIPLYGMSPW